jgi:putative MFS transporter
LIILLSLGFFFELYDLLYTGYVAPGLVKSGILLPTTPGLFGSTGIASFVAALFAGLFIGTIACGFLADRFGRRSIFTYSLIWYTAANLLLAFQNTAFWLNFWRFVSGVGIGTELIVIGTYLSELVPKNIRGRAFACCQAIGFCAVPVAAFVSYLFVPRTPLGIDGWRWVVLIGAHGALFIWWIRRALPESPRWLVEHGRFAEAERIMTVLERRVEIEHGSPLPPAVMQERVIPHRSLSEMWRRPYRDRVIMMIIFNVFQVVSFYGFANWVPTLLIKQGVTITDSLLYTTIIALAAPIGPLFGLAIADRFERKSVLVIASLAIIACGLAFSQARGAAAIVLLGACLTIANNVMSYTYHAYQQELFPTGIRARVVGFVYSWGRFSAIFTGFFIAFFLQHFGVTGVFVFIAGSMIVVALVIGLMGPRTRNLALEAISS